ncbi:type III polyketide synthase [Nesterenkonia alkaliphila]|uniref:Type III polyketide synthase n=1 Tax=Nesterenkonia alkaliphila TaxID=1463631 RepID=A0A7K1UH27_9MICC|nr:type III polyketide synthase [Nesterenkonia alkaliphila]MVT25763.1 type III polyketide synthase [Nesterenkonia alkaliphila]GFZ93101.1 naringenin-chalcone synthase [Nesterenkonia alkaliphila]
MPTRITSIGTAVPETCVSQQELSAFFAAQPTADRLTRRLIPAAFDAAGIDRRHTVLEGLSGAPDSAFIAEDGTLQTPGTGLRNDLYKQQAPPLAADAARRALTGGNIHPDQVTHVVSVSCTGFFAPGIDYRLIRDLGLSSTVERSHLGFMGCAAALPGLRLAAQVTEARPEAVVLVVCVELCSLHIRHTSDPEQIVAASVFADGAAAAVVTGGEIGKNGAGLILERFATALTEEGESDMAWTIGDHGFQMTLSAEVPRIIGREIRAAVSGFLADTPPPDTWAVHPGGRSVLDRVETGLNLSSQALTASRQVLRDYGNMSSATILFILQQLMADPEVSGGIAALAFGPGLTVESALMYKEPVT